MFVVHFNFSLDYLLMRFTFAILSTFVLSALAGKKALHKRTKHGQKYLRALKDQGYNSMDDLSSIWMEYVPESVSVASPARGVNGSFFAFNDYTDSTDSSPVTVDPISP